MKRLLITFVVALIVGAGFGATVMVGTADAHHNFWAGCNTNTAYAMSGWTRSQARSFADVGSWEGYHWGGGCWNSNNVDDQPGDPQMTSGTHGEGGDCSGFTFKSWGLRNSETSSGYWYWPRMHNIHGPFTASEFKAGDGPQILTVAKSSVKYMDALASADHSGMIFTAGSTANSDTIIEAKGEAAGTGRWTRTYKGSSAYSGVRRAGGCIWEGICS